MVALVATVALVGDVAIAGAAGSALDRAWRRGGAALVAPVLPFRPPARTSAASSGVPRGTPQ
jgi:hypothetical protein